MATADQPATIPLVIIDNIPPDSVPVPPDWVPHFSEISVDRGSYDTDFV